MAQADSTLDLLLLRNEVERIIEHLLITCQFPVGLTSQLLPKRLQRMLSKLSRRREWGNKSHGG